ncbi:translocon-associated alpha [Pyrrhoderma noxium]|uniref:Translocon-associated alpha n=1 Tax=Pyrrhoderma noxium TaxID=2282107 RepID=A0A286UAJ7_9AGAM|nr:translocon-associated alpha [Pyrrhoderma noxium]
MPDLIISAVTVRPKIDAQGTNRNIKEDVARVSSVLTNSIMRPLSFLPFLAFLANFALVKAEDTQLQEPEVTVTASFPENNPFGQIVNGERNRLNLLIENLSEYNVTLISVAGSIHDAKSDALIKNVTTLPYGLRLISGTKVQLPYQFHSEFKPGDVRLNLWLTHSLEDNLYRVTAYDSIVTVVEPEVSIFDYQVITTYLITFGFIGGLGYLAYNSFVPKSRKIRKPASAKPTGSTTDSIAGTGNYEEEWIPEHHLKLRSNKKKSGALSSGDELSGSEVSGTEGKRRKDRK